MTRNQRMTWTAAGLVAGLLPVAGAGLGLSQWLGAHPWWAMQTALIGTPVGLVLGLGLTRLRRWRGVVVAAVALICALGLAHYGKTQFAATYAEDVLAGRIWYFGWIGAAAAAAATTFAALAPRP